MTRASRLLAVSIVVVALALTVAPVRSQISCCPPDGPLVAYAFEQITVSTVAVGFTKSVYNAGGKVPHAAEVTLETNNIRYRDDGTDPTATVGQPVAANSSLLPVLWVLNQSIGRFKAIRSGGADAVLNVTYYAPPG